MRWQLILLSLCGLILLSGCSGAAQQAADWVLEEEGAVTLSDGTQVDLWHLGHNDDGFYKLSDGTLLLRIDTPCGPQNSFAAGVESFDDLSPAAQEAVSAYYEAQGLLYDPQAQLEDAYATYLDCQTAGTEYQERYIRQEIYPVACNDTIMCFLTSVILPVEGENDRTVQELSLSAVFDRDTGERLRIWDLFTLPEEETRQRLLDLAAGFDPVLRSEAEAALRPEYIIPRSDGLELTFPQGSLPSQEYTWGTSVPYSDLQDVLRPWAILDGESD